MTPEQDKIIEKVLKLLELAKDERGHDGERESASRMAAKLMEQYSLDFVDINTGKPKNGVFQKYEMEQDEYLQWADVLANGICNAFDVKLLCSKRNGWTMIFCGTRSDIDIAVFFYKYLRRSVGVMTSRSFSKAADRQTFAISMVVTINRRMRELYEKRNEMYSSDSKALMVVKQTGLTEFVKEQFPNAGNAGRVKTNGSREAYNAGVEAGKKVNISRPISGNNSYQGAIA